MWITDSSISAGLTFTVESSSSTAVRSSRSTRARRKECVRQWGGTLPYCGNIHQWKTRRNVQSCETSATTHTNTYVQIAAGLGLAFVVFSWLHGEFTLSLWYYPIQPVWPSGNPLFSYMQHLELIRQAPDTVKRLSLSHTHTKQQLNTIWHTHSDDHTLTTVCMPPAILYTNNIAVCCRRHSEMAIGANQTMALVMLCCIATWCWFFFNLLEIFQQLLIPDCQSLTFQDILYYAYITL